MVESLPDDTVQLRLGNAPALCRLLFVLAAIDIDHIMIVARIGKRGAVKAFHPLGLHPADTKGAGDIVGNVGRAEGNGGEIDQHAARKQRNIGDRCTKLHQRNAQFALFLGQAGHARSDGRRHHCIHFQMRGAHRHVDIAHRRRIAEQNVDIHAQLIGVQPLGIADALHPVQRVKRGLRMQDQLAFRVDALLAARQQIIDMLLRNAVAGQIDLHGRDAARQPPCAEGNMDTVDIDAGHALRLFYRGAHGELGGLNVGDISALHTTAFALAGAENGEFALFGHPGDKGGNLGRSDIERGNQPLHLRRGHQPFSPSPEASPCPALPVTASSERSSPDFNRI